MRAVSKKVYSDVSSFDVVVVVVEDEAGRDDRTGVLEAELVVEDGSVLLFSFTTKSRSSKGFFLSTIFAVGGIIR